MNTNLTSPTSGTFLISLFNNPLDAEEAYNDLLKQGYTKDDITIIMSEDTKNEYFSDSDISETDLGTKSLEGMGVGGAIGGTVGAIAAAIAAAGTSLAIPGLGIVMSGALAAGFAGAGAGAVTGGLIGALVGLGFPDEQAKEYEAGIKAGGVVLGVNAKSEEDYIQLSNQWKSLQNINYTM